MEKHKLLFMLKSNFAFERFKKLFDTNPVYRKNFEVHYENINTYDDLAYYLEFNTPELLILDTKLSEFGRLEDLLLSHQLSFILFDSDFDSTTEHIKEHFGISDEQEDETVKEITITKDPHEEKEKVVIKEKIIEKEVIKTNYTSIKNKIVVVASLWSGAGSTTFSMNLARAISERGLEVSYVEFPLSKPYVFDYLSIPVKEEEREITYIDLAKEIQQERLARKHKAWSDFGINWYVTDTRNEPFLSFTYEDMLKYVYSINSVVTIVDVSHHLHDDNVQKFLHHADEIFICVDPDPVKIDWLATVSYDGKIAKYQRLEQQIIQHLKNVEKKEGIEYQFVTMKYSPVVKKQEWEDCLDKVPICYFPVVPYEILIKNVWDSTVLYDLEEYVDIIENALKPVIVKLLPREFYSLERKTNKKKSLLNIFKKGE